MCYHYSLTKEREKIMRMIEGEWESPFEPVYHAPGFSYPAMPVLTIEKPKMVQQYYWGLIPAWVRTMAEAQMMQAVTLNAKIETIFEKPAFRNSVNNRCIILADGFIEWMEYRKKKYPHYIQLKNNDIFGFGGLYAHWLNKETGELISTFTIVTMEANDFMARIHNTKRRMPLVFEKEQWMQWLNPVLQKEDIIAAARSCSNAVMKAQTISKRITARGADTNVPEVLHTYQYPELLSGEQGSLFGL